ncbi:MAG: 4-carboxymuconolactone decarboxylase / 3-oxoadipate enol-lactonase [Marmoricola sp.]|nr:4-carboxymuconolactone decarboxylase / 3-oxoadipate enol-lactonase [Marmoricola sp.]
MTVPSITATRMTGAAHRAELPLLVLGPSLGTSAATLWATCARGLSDVLDVVAWDLPGHGHNHAVPADGFTMAELAAGVLRTVDDVQEQRGDRGGPFAYAGDSVGGAVGLQLLLDHPDRVSDAVLLCTGAQIGDPAMWQGRIGQVSVSGTPVMVPGSAERWFGPGFLEAHPEVASPLLHALSDADDTGYAQVCEALAGFDVRDRLGEVRAPVLAVAGETDAATPPAKLREIADGVRSGRFVELPGVGHLAPAEAPAVVARLVREHVLGEQPPQEAPTSPAPSYAAGMSVRREVLGDAHVDRATAGATDLTRDFQEFITTYAWGGIWTRPGLDRRSRSMITLTALIARGHHEELAMHVRAARTNGLTVEEIKEVILQSAIYCGVPDANTAFRIAQQALAEPGADPGTSTTDAAPDQPGAPS